MSLPSDDNLRLVCNAIGTKEGITLNFTGFTVTLNRYAAFRFSRFLEQAIMDSCRISGKKIDHEFEHGRDDK